MATVASHRLDRCYCNGSIQSTADNDTPAALPVSGAADAASDHRVCRARIFENEFGEKQVMLYDESGSSGITSPRFYRKRSTAGNTGQGLGRSICKHSRSTNASCLMELKKRWQGLSHGLTGSWPGWALNVFVLHGIIGWHVILCNMLTHSSYVKLTVWCIMRIWLIMWLNLCVQFNNLFINIKYPWCWWCYIINNN